MLRKNSNAESFRRRIFRIRFPTCVAEAISTWKADTVKIFSDFPRKEEKLPEPTWRFRRRPYCVRRDGTVSGTLFYLISQRKNSPLEIRSGSCSSDSVFVNYRKACGL